MHLTEGQLKGEEKRRDQFFVSVLMRCPLRVDWNYFKFLQHKGAIMFHSCKTGREIGSVNNQYLMFTLPDDINLV